MKAKHEKKLWHLLRILTLVGFVTAALLITPMAPAVAQGDGVSIAVRAGDPTSIPADGKSSTVLVVTVSSSSRCAEEAQAAYIAGGEGSLIGEVTTTLGSVSPDSFGIPPYEREITLVAGEQVGQATITVKVIFASGDLNLGDVLEDTSCRASTNVTFVEPGTSPEDTGSGDVPEDSGPAEPEKSKPRLTEEMIDDIVFVINAGMSLGQEIKPDQLPHWDQLTPNQQRNLTEVLVFINLMQLLSQAKD